MPQPSGHLDRRRELLVAWERRCRARGHAEHCSGADALFLVTAVSNALRRGSETPELGRAARTWGARFSAPVDTLAALSMLREALSDLAEDSPDGLPVPFAVLHRVFDQATMEAVDAASANLRSAARRDPLTGCANRRALDEDLAHAAASARRSNLDLAVAVVDLDGLKLINDTEGHAAGDRALVDLVSTLRQALREADTLYRTGGDEFVVVAPFTDAAGARALLRRAERLAGPSFSWGVASLRGTAGAAAPTALMDAADTDLYERRRSTRRAAVLAQRKRRATTVASVAASVAVTASMAGLAVALDSGGAVPASSGLAAGSNGSSGSSGSSGSNGSSGQGKTATGNWPTPGLRAPSGNSALSSSQPGSGNADVTGGTTGASLVGVLGTVVPPTLLLPAVPPPLPTGTVTGPAPVTAVLPTLIVPVTTTAQPIALATYVAPTAPAPAPSPVTAALSATGPGKGNGHGGGGARTTTSATGPKGHRHDR